MSTRSIGPCECCQPTGDCPICPDGGHPCYSVVLAGFSTVMFAGFPLDISALNGTYLVEPEPCGPGPLSGCCCYQGPIGVETDAGEYALLFMAICEDGAALFNIINSDDTSFTLIADGEWVTDCDSVASSEDFDSISTDAAPGGTATATGIACP